MAYSTIDDIRDSLSDDVLVYLTDDTGAGTTDEARVAAEIEKADSEIEAYCQKRYSLPFDPVPAVIRSLSVDVAIYRLFARRGFREDTADKAIVDKYKNAVRILQDIAKGVIQIGTGDAPHEPATFVRSRARTKIFTEEELDQY